MALPDLFQRLCKRGAIIIQHHLTMHPNIFRKIRSDLIITRSPQWPFTSACEIVKKRGEIGKVGKVSIESTAKLRRKKEN